MTEAQEKFYWRLWARACKHQGWTTKAGLNSATINAKRKEVMAALGFASSKEIRTNEDFGRVKNRFLFLAGDLNGATEDGDPNHDERRRLLDVIADHFKCARVYDPHDAYLKKVLAPRFKIVDGWSAIEDLSPEPTLRKNWKTGKVEEGPSELMQCVYTIARCVNDLRNKHRDTIHDMKIKAGVVCGCASICQKVLADSHREEVPVNEDGVAVPF